MPTYNGESIVNLLTTAVAADANVKAKLWDKQLQRGAESVDDFAPFEGPEGSKKPFIVKRDLNANSGDEIKMTVMSAPRGSGVRGEQALTGNESQVDFKTFGCIVDFWRDGIVFTEKQLKFLAAGGGVKAAALQMLKKKLGLRRMNDMKLALKLRVAGGVGHVESINGFAPDAPDPGGVRQCVVAAVSAAKFPTAPPATFTLRFEPGR